MDALSSFHKQFIDEWTPKLENVVSNTLQQWSGREENFRTLYNELAAYPPQTNDDLIIRRLTLTIFPTLCLQFASLTNGGAPKANNDRMSSRQLRILVPIIAVGRPAPEEEVIIQRNLLEWRRAGHRWRKIAKEHGSGYLITISTEADKKILGKTSYANKDLTELTKQCTRPWVELNNLCANALEKLCNAIRREQDLVPVSTSISSGHKRKRSQTNQNGENDFWSRPKTIGQASHQKLYETVAPHHDNAMLNDDNQKPFPETSGHDIDQSKAWQALLPNRSDPPSALGPLPSFDISNLDTREQLEQDFLGSLHRGSSNSPLLFPGYMHLDQDPPITP